MEALAIRKEHFNDILERAYPKAVLTNIPTRYKKSVQEPLHLHRNEMATNFENRIDYVDISAFGVGRVDEKALVSKVEIEQLERGQDKEKRLF